MKKENKNGPKVLGSIPKPEKIAISAINELVESSNSIVVDTRDRTQFMEGHLKGSILATWNKTFNTIVGSYVNVDQDIYLIIEEDLVEEAVLDLIRIGLDNIKGFIIPHNLKCINHELVHTNTIDFHQVDEMLPTGDYTLLDVRKETEFNEGHGQGAINIAHTRLLDRIGEVPLEKPVIVHCKSGARASAAASLLERFKYKTYYVDDVVDPWLKDVSK